MRARDVLRAIDAATEAVKVAPVVAVRCSNAGMGVLGFLDAYGLAMVGLRGFDVPRDHPHLRARAKANRKRNRAARRARRANR